VVEQDEIRRRIRSLMWLAGYESLEELVVPLSFGITTLKELGVGKRTGADADHLREIARICGVSYGWFTIPDLRGIVAGYEDEASLAERVEALEGRVDALYGRLGEGGT
jgi:hypothetical protein